MRPTRYRIVIAGELSRRFASAFDGMTLQCHDGQTSLVGTVTDQAHLHGLLNQVGELGLDLVSVAALENEVLHPEQRRGGSVADARTA